MLELTDYCIHEQTFLPWRLDFLKRAMMEVLYGLNFQESARPCNLFEKGFKLLYVLYLLNK